MASFFELVEKRPIYRWYNLFRICAGQCDWLFHLQHKLCATFSANVNINYRLPIKVYYRRPKTNCNRNYKCASIFTLTHRVTNKKSPWKFYVLKTEIKIKNEYFLLLSVCHYGSSIVESEIFWKIQLRRKAMTIGIIIHI
jgi:hypothetical protein